MSRRKICYVTGARADFGLMQSTLQRIHRSDLLELSIIATGMHLLPKYGLTVRQIEAAGLPVTARIAVQDGPPSGALMAKNIGRMLIGLVEEFETIRPNIVLVLGDRGEMLAAALAAIHLNIAVVHIHGGERSGTVDEPVRHAISKLAHFHFVATDESKSRLVRMGEAENRIAVVGAPGIDGLRETKRVNRSTLCAGVGLDPARPVALLVYHPVLQEADRSGSYVAMIVDAVLAKGLQVMALEPNSDAGSGYVRAALEVRASAGEIRVATHLRREEYLSWLAASDILVGNSSSGIIEAATFGTPVVNVGSRQNLRQRNANVIDCPMDRDGLEAAVERALALPRSESSNVYGDGKSGERIARLLVSIDLSESSVAKANVY
ncbi:UDP-N-acetylglucosamine 2-epimerase (hydrolyzing) [Bradyrhizobium sp. KBS0727]|uniref:UDP-N-acetylglucosamine 2-epimerase n=1 Tax=unclassified Bradyrhizobium TaxID=2631580 RepID=UPI00110EA110|nr:MULTISPECIES: UDP-N-acetylglucosamine 2-epimerase [unclassified Bradyrhizobium]QDW39802.1 UDP-N-acetylglucosamine 2-epimerase (hydrolyzing) [Bradyrhizobium sp. KBS0725]QDW46405.1 UDP-N-acetylglucosamine 2-epimerase (hydrolyzing) [Bradyrhizobium sp. KBS0727]